MTSLLNIAGNIPVVEAGGQSLRFEDGDSPSFSFEFGAPTNQIKWTMSFWCKRGEIGREHAIYGAANGGGETFFVAFYPDDIEAYISNGRNHVTNAVFRDPSAWHHIVQVFDSANSTANDRFITYVNGVRQTTSTNSVALNDTTAWNTSGVTGYFGKNYGAWFGDSRDHFDGYLANVTFIDGQALTPTSFGEYDDTLWKPKSDDDITSNLTFGTNGFYLPFKQTTEAEGFSTVTYTGNGGTQSIEGVGFEPDFVWLKSRNAARSHGLFDSVRGVTKGLASEATSSEYTSSAGNDFVSFDSSGFTVGTPQNFGSTNTSGDSIVAWCWDAGTGSAASNTDGTITSTVKANTAKGFSIATWTGNATGGATFGHGLSSAPEMVIVKNRTDAENWSVFHTSVGNTKSMTLNSTDAALTSTTYWNDTSPSASVVTLGSDNSTNGSSDNMVAYCFHSVSGYSSFGSYSGTGSAGNTVTGLGFKPAFIIIKRKDASDNWVMFDNTRDPVNSAEKYLLADLSQAEATFSTVKVDFDSDGFTLQGSANSINNSSGTYIYMAFADTRDATFFGDTSGNGNNWTPNALNNTDVLPDSPVTGGNFASWNPISQQTSSTTFSEGNLKALIPASTANGKAMPTMGVSSGKWYWEYYYSVSNGNYLYVGITDPSAYTNNSYWIRGSDGETFKYENGTNSTGSGTTHRHTQGDIIQVAFDADNGKWYVGKNGTWSLSGDPVAGTGYVHNNIVSGEYGAFAANATSSSTQTVILNTGADSSFAGNATPQGNTDDNGVGDFYYAPPSGFLALTTGNLPAATITAPDEYFNTLLWTGDGTSSRGLTGVGFQPDMVWTKRRSTADNHHLFDAVRVVSSVPQRLFPNLTNAEDGNFGSLDSFDSDGFTVGANVATNASGETFVGWSWLAGNSTSSNTDGSITSTVSANQTAGFSVVSFTGNATAGATVGHGLSSAPEMLILKNRDNGSEYWTVYHEGIGNTKSLFLNAFLQSDTSASYWNNTSPTASVFSLGGNPVNNGSGNGIICYAFHSVEGYSKIGSYTGNGSTDGTFVHCGFRPAWVMVKRANGGASWYINDAKRSPYNVSNSVLLPDANVSEQTEQDKDLLSNGFKIRASDVGGNSSGETYIFIAFSEAPFKSANAR